VGGIKIACGTADSASHSFRGIRSSGNHRVGLIRTGSGAAGSSFSHSRAAAFGHGSADNLASADSFFRVSFGAVYRTIPFGS
jgi:hypothetical protein